MTTRIATPDCHLYRVVDSVTGKFYVGKHNGSVQQGYWGSGLRINRHIKKHGKQNMKYEILVIGSEKYIFDIEKMYLTDEFIKSNPDCLNLCKGGIGGNVGNIPWNKGLKTPDSVKAKQSASRMGKTSPRKGKKHTSEAIERLRKAKAGFRISDEAQKKAAIGRLGRKLQTVQCTECGTIGGKPAMQRWHFSNCKNRKA
jgi:hypothetical protein